MRTERIVLIQKIVAIRQFLSIKNKPDDGGADLRRLGHRRSRPVVGGAPGLTVALVEAVDAFRRAWSRARGNRPAQDLAAIAAVLQRGLTGGQVVRVWLKAQPAAREAEPGNMNAIIRQASAVLAQRGRASRTQRPSRPPDP